MATKQRAKAIKKTTKRPALHSHITASLTSTASHKHSGKKIHTRHTSHGFLLAMLLLTGIVLFSNLGALKAFGLSQSGSLSVTVDVAGAAPTQGAEISFPANNTQTTSPLITVTGTCPYQTLVTIYNNGYFAGSSICTVDDVFSITITLTPGINVLQAQNYDGLNQPGPVTAQHIVFYEVIPGAAPADQPVVTEPQQLTPIPNPPSPLPVAPEPSVRPCYDSFAKQLTEDTPSATPRIVIGCIHRSVYPGEEFSFSVAVNGGNAPYALDIDWSDGSRDLRSISSNQTQSVQHTYQNPGSYTITLYTTDANGLKYQIQSVVIVNGEPITGIAPVGGFVNDVKQLWIESPVPLYIAAVLLVLGFWVGDIFQRFYGNHPLNKSKKRHA